MAALPDDLSHGESDDIDFSIYTPQVTETLSRADAPDGLEYVICYPPNAQPPSSNRDLAEPRPKLASSFTFGLDPFQLHACKCVDDNVSVLVSAHTSAGKVRVDATT